MKTRKHTTDNVIEGYQHCARCDGLVSDTIWAVHSEAHVLIAATWVQMLVTLVAFGLLGSVYPLPGQGDADVTSVIKTTLNLIWLRGILLAITTVCFLSLNNSRLKLRRLISRTVVDRDGGGRS